MTLGDLPEIELFHGIFTLINVIISIVIGLRIASKYVEYKRKELLTVGLSLTFGGSVYWSSVIAFITIIFFNYEPGLAFHMAFHIFPPIGLLLWIYSISLLLYPKSLKKIVVIFTVICMVYEFFLLYYLLTDPSLLGRRTGIILNETYLLINSFLLFSVSVIVITTVLFTRQSLKSDDPRIRWKGKFIFIGTILFLIAGTIGIIIPDSPVQIVLTRTIYIIGSIASYIGWLLPERIAKLLIKD
ncbi:MAG: hypothetical protein ACFFDK_11765 [Promethearchaeota archaeon]